jgi:ATP synthase protein I
LTRVKRTRFAPPPRCSISLRRDPEGIYNPAFASAGSARAAPWVTPPLKTKPIRTVLRWQLVATAVVAAIAGSWAGAEGAISAVLGGAVNVVATVAYAFLLGLGLAGTPIPSAGASLVAMFRAEAGKIVVIAVGLWLSLSLYRSMVIAAFFSAFVITVIVFSMAILVREQGNSGGR